MKNFAAVDRSFEALKKGDSASFERIINKGDVTAFADVSGDRNPLHMDDSYAGKTSVGKRIVHGMLLGALVSRLVGMHLPGRRALLMKETLAFKEPVAIGARVVVTGTITHTSAAVRLVEIAISITCEKTLVCSGTAHVQVLE